MEKVFKRKQPLAHSDYTKAVAVVNTLHIGLSCNVTIEGQMIIFRKYVYDLGAKCQKKFTTKKTGDKSLKIFRIE